MLAILFRRVLKDMDVRQCEKKLLWGDLPLETSWRMPLIE
jgi:hypothetical protein